MFKRLNNLLFGLRVLVMRYGTMISLLLALTAIFPVLAESFYGFFGKGEDVPGWIQSMMPFSVLGASVLLTGSQALMGLTIMLGKMEGDRRMMYVLWGAVYGGAVWTMTVGHFTFLTGSKDLQEALQLSVIGSNLILFFSTLVTISSMEFGLLGLLRVGVAWQGSIEEMEHEVTVRRSVNKDGIKISDKVLLYLREQPKPVSTEKLTEILEIPSAPIAKRTMTTLARRGLVEKLADGWVIKKGGDDE